MSDGRVMLRAAAALLVIAGVCGVGRGEETQVDAKALAEKGRVMNERIKRDGAGWTAEIDTNEAGVVQVEKMVRGGKARYSVAFRLGARVLPVTEIVVTDGLWYVTRDGKKEKFRENEADFGGLPVYAYLAMAETGVFVSEETSGKVAGTAGGLVKCRVEMPEELRRQIAKMLEDGRKMLSANPDGKGAPEYQKTLEKLEKLLAEGSVREFDAETGIMARATDVSKTLTVRDFRILSEKDERAFEIKGNYVDQTGPLAASMDDVVMMGHNSYWRAGGKLGDLETVLVDLKTGNYRRVPYAGIGGGGGFSADRKKAWVSAQQMGSSAMSIVEVDLATGANRRFGGKLANSGFNMGAEASPDGKWVCFGHREIGGAAMINAQWVLVDLKTGEEQTVGEKADDGFMNWAEGNVMVFPRRERVDMSQPGAGEKIPASTVCKMDLQGKVTELVKGSLSVVLGDGKTILYQSAKQWKTCDLEGKNEKMVGDSLAGYSFPAAAPDGKRVLMMYYGDKTKGPQPRIVTVETGAVEEVKVGPGFWAIPVWR
jgi:hypothetical protein